MACPEVVFSRFLSLLLKSVFFVQNNDGITALHFFHKMSMAWGIYKFYNTTFWFGLHERSDYSEYSLDFASGIY